MNSLYPPTRREQAVDTLAGVAFEDPYRWLERDSDEVRAWQLSQAGLAEAHVGEWPYLDALKKLVAHFTTERFVMLPRFAGGQWFYARAAEGASQAQVIVSSELYMGGRVLFDPAAEDFDRPPFLSWTVPSPDGRTLAIGICVDGSENNTIRLIDVKSGRMLSDVPPQTLMDARTGGVQWLPDSSGFFFSAITSSAIEFEQQVFLHRRVPSPTTTRVDIQWTEDRDYRVVTIGGDGRHAIALERLRKPIPVAVASLTAKSLHWRPFVTQIDGTVAGHIVGDRYVAVTDVLAPRGRLVAIPLDSEDPNDHQQWEELVPQSDAVLRTITPVGDVLYLTEYVDTYTRIRVVSHQGEPLEEPPLPTRGAINEMAFPLMNLVGRPHPQMFVFAFSSLTVGPGIYVHAAGDAVVRTLRGPAVELHDTVVEDLVAISSDGTPIPYRAVRRSDLSSDHPHPTLIYAYGGLNVPWVPQFPGHLAAFVAAGGVYVHAHLRGGGEFGLEWWQAGRMANKQNCYDDLFAVAEHLSATNRCTPELLAVTGGSNGGLLAGVAVTQRPDLWKVVVPQVPWLDLIGTCRDPWGKMYVTKELADVDDPAQVRRLAAISPYHLVREGVRYPAVYLEAGDTDPRCPPWHARKFAARLQQATSGTAPILLHVWDNVGHGAATDKNVALAQNTEWLGFVMRHLGVAGWE